jgi:hypothetical protein
MKKVYLIALATILTLNFSFAAPVIKAVANGYWGSANTWDLSRLPRVGDTIIISAGRTVAINDDQDLNGFVYIKVFGKINFQNNNSTLNLGNTATVIVYNNGVIVGGGSASQKIRIGNDQVYKGNEADVVGPEMANASTNGFVSFSQSTLPVKFVGFTLTKKNADMFIQWSTAEELNADMYELERSYDGSNWNTIAYIAAIGNSSDLNNYSYSDKNITSKVVYYRVKQVDKNGSFTYTSIKSMKNETAIVSDIKIASVQNKVLLQFPIEIKGSVVVRFVNLNGQVIDQQTINQPIGQVVLNTKVKGNHIVSVSNGDDVNVAKQIVL